MLTRDQLLKPRRATRPVQLAEFDEPVLLGEPSGLLSLRLRELQKRHGATTGEAAREVLASEEGFSLILSDMVVDEAGAPLLSRDEARALIGRLSNDSLTALFAAFAALSTGGAAQEAAEPVPSQPSPSAK